MKVFITSYTQVIYWILNGLTDKNKTNKNLFNDQAVLHYLVLGCNIRGSYGISNTTYF